VIQLHAKDVPCIDMPDIGALSTCDTVTSAAAQMDAACREFGYFKLANHRIDPERALAVIAESRSFFTRPALEKEVFRADIRTQFLGYRSLGAEKSLFHGGAEACEQYRIGNCHDPEKGADRIDRSFFHAPFTRSLSFFHEMNALADRLMVLAAIGNNQEPEIFAPYFAAPMHRLGLNYYEPGSGKRIGNRVGYGMSPHVDRAVFTLVIQDERGLEVLSPHGGWISVPAGPGKVFGFIGDYFQRWTNGGFRAVQHRVGEVAKDRISIQYKHKPSHATLVSPLAPFTIDRNEPARYEPFDTGPQYERLLASLLS
jgi:isopenicillin N synthase-like dioxygenase